MQLSPRGPGDPHACATSQMRNREITKPLPTCDELFFLTKSFPPSRASLVSLTNQPKRQKALGEEDGKHADPIFLEIALSSSFFLNKFIYLFMAALGLRCCAWAFSSCGEQGLLFIVVHGLCSGAPALGARASVVVAHRLSSCGARVQLLRCMWDLPGSGLEPLSLALAGRFLSTAPPGKSCSFNISKGCVSRDRAL